MTQRWENILLVAGSGRNVGKTTFICRVLAQLSEQEPIAIKISPHFHQPTAGLKLLSEDVNYQVFKETDRTIDKDSSLFLQHGAHTSIYVQVNDENLQEAFIALLPYLDAEKPILIESAALHKYISSGLFLFIYNEESEKKPSTEANLKIADMVIKSDGKSFSIQPEQVKFDNEWKITT